MPCTDLLCGGHNGSKSWGCQPVCLGRQLTLHKEQESLSTGREADSSGEEQ